MYHLGKCTFYSLSLRISSFPLPFLLFSSFQCYTVAILTIDRLLWGLFCAQRCLLRELPCSSLDAWGWRNAFEMNNIKLIW